MNTIRLFLIGFIPITFGLTGCNLFMSQDKLVDLAAQLVIDKFQNASCEEVAQMQPTSGDASLNEKDAVMQQKAMEVLQNNPELRERFINQVAGPMANRMIDCNLVP